MLSSRGFNIDSLAVGETEDPHLSRMTFVVMGDDRVLEQVRKQLEKIVTVVRVIDISREDYVERDLMLMKVDAAPRGRMRSASWPTSFAPGSSTWPRDVAVEIAGP
jgi:acetolactate synthase-1/3 small subunit